MGELAEAAPVPEEKDSWAETLRRIEEEAARARALQKEEEGRGKRRRVTAKVQVRSPPGSVRSDGSAQVC
jgi:hypothetical protein